MFNQITPKQRRKILFKDIILYKNYSNPILKPSNKSIPTKLLQPKVLAYSNSHRQCQMPLSPPLFQCT